MLVRASNAYQQNCESLYKGKHIDSTRRALGALLQKSMGMCREMPILQLFFVCARRQRRLHHAARLCEMSTVDYL